MGDYENALLSIMFCVGAYYTGFSRVVRDNARTDIYVTMFASQAVADVRAGPAIGPEDPR